MNKQRLKNKIIIVN